MRNKARSNRFGQRIDFPSDIQRSCVCGWGSGPLTRKLDRAHRLSGFVRDPHTPFGAFPEFAAGLSQYFACRHDRLAARFL